MKNLRKLSKVMAGLLAILALGSVAIMPGGASHSCPAGYVHPVGFWKTHSIYATVPALQMPWPIPEDAQLCGMTYYEIVSTPPQGCVWHILARQWIVVLLNAISGCELPSDVYQAIWEADVILGNCPVLEGDRDLAISLAELFEAYNEGLLGVPSCPH